MQALTLGMIGFGTIAPFYDAAIRANPRLVLGGVYVPEKERQMELLRTNHRVYASVEEILSDSAIDAVIVATPNFLHAPLSIQSLEAGKHVLCEKPMATSAADAARMIEAATRANKYLAVAFHNRYSPLVTHFLRSSPQKQIVSFEAVFNENILNHSNPSDAWYFRKAFSGGGCVIDNGTNFIDVLYTIVGSLNVVSARLERGSREVETQASVVFSFAHDSRGVLTLDWESKTEEKRITFTYEDGTTHTIDFLMLERPGMPGSHMIQEYESILAEFYNSIHSRAGISAQGVEVQKIIEHIYA